MHLRIDRPSRRIAVAVLVTATALLLRLAADSVLQDRLPFAVFFIATAVVVRLAGGWAAAFTALAGGIAVKWLFVPPLHELDLASTTFAFTMLGYLLGCAAIIALGVSATRARARALACAAQAKYAAERLARAQRAARIATFEIDLETRTAAFICCTEALEAGAPPRAEPLEAWLARVHPDDRPRLEAKLAAALTSEGIDYTHQFRIIDARGTPRWLAARGEVRRDASGRLQLVGVNIDITDSVRDSEALLRSEEKYRSLFEHSLDAIYLTHPDGMIDEANPAACALLGRTREELTGLRRDDVIEPSPGLIAGLERREQTGSARGELTMIRGDGSQVRVEVSSTIIGRGTPVERALVIARDITERKHAEEELRESALRLRVLGDQIPNGAIYQHITRPDGHVVFQYMSAGMERHFGYRVADVLAVSTVLRRQILEEDLPRIDAAEQRSSRELAPFDCEFRQRTAAGEVRWVHCRAMPRRLEDGSTLWDGLVVDTTDHKAVEEALRKSEAKMRAVFNALNEGVIVLDARGELEEANQAITRQFGCPPEALREAALQGKLRVIRPDGSLLPIQEHPQYEVLRTGKAVRDVELGIVLPGGQMRWVLSNAQPLLDDHGENFGVVASTVDITARKQNEEALREADRRRTEFLAVLSHELRNPLAPIRNCVHILDRVEPGSEPAKRALATIDRQVSHMTRLIDDLLDVTRITRGKMLLKRERLELGELVRRTVEDHRSIFAKNGVELRVDAPPESQWVLGDATRLAQVVGNLLMNSAKFCQPGGATTLALQREGGLAAIRVRDNGRGIAPEVLPRLFQPFVQADATLDRSMGGLGLGLALTKGIVELHGGSVAARSDGVGRGAEFVVHLPVEGQPSATLQASARAVEEARAGGRRVLVIDDNVDAADTMRELLEFEGHLVDVATDGERGLELARRARPDVILCDIGLPGISGYDVARAVRSEPELRGILLVAITGYAASEDVAAAREAGFDHHLPKPPDIAEVERLIRPRA